MLGFSLNRTPICPASLLPHLHFQAARRAVLTPFDGTTCRGGLPRQATVFRDLWEAWAALVVRLVDDGWDAKAGTRFVANCPYFGVHKHTWYPCNRALICPFCWGRRRVIRPFCKIVPHLPKTRAARNTHQLVEFCHTWETFFGERGIDLTFQEDVPLERLIANACSRIKQSRKVEIQAATHLGAFVSHTFDLKRDSKDIRKFSCIYRRRGVMLIRSDQLVTTLPATKYDYLPATAGELVKILGRIGQYPVGWLKYGTTGQILRYLKGFSGIHMLSRFGAWTDKKRL